MSPWQPPAELYPKVPVAILLSSSPCVRACIGANAYVCKRRADERVRSLDMQEFTPLMESPLPQSRSSCPPSFPASMCCDRQPDVLFCLIAIAVHSDYSVTRRP